MCKVPKIEEVKLSQNYVYNIKQFGTKICLLPNNVTVYVQRQYIYKDSVECDIYRKFQYTSCTDTIAMLFE